MSSKLGSSLIIQPVVSIKHYSQIRPRLESKCGSEIIIEGVGDFTFETMLLLLHE